MAIPVIYQLITMVIFDDYRRGAAQEEFSVTDECEGAFYRADARGGSL